MPGIRSTAAWQKLRLQVLTEEPYCWLCGEPGPTTADHIVPLAIAPHLALERSNVRAAHGRKIPGVCPGNYGRGARPARGTQATPTRQAREPEWTFHDDAPPRITEHTWTL